MTYAQHYNRRVTPQNEQASPKQVANNAGGFSFAVTNWTQLHRFLVLGSEKGSYYVGERKLTRENAKVVERCLNDDFMSAIEAIVEISEKGRAPKNSPAIFALALAASYDNPDCRKVALTVMPRVCRTGTHLFEFVNTVQQMRGWGRGLRRAIGQWYVDKGESLPYQLVKYRQRHGWTHRDVLRKAHVGAQLSDENEAALRWAVAGPDGMGKREVVRGEHVEVQPATAELPRIVDAFELAKGLSGAKLAEVVELAGLTREMVPSEHLNDSKVWASLLRGMPMTAMIRNLGKMTAVGLIKPLSEAANTVAARLCDRERIRRARVHPLAILTAMRVYRQGRGIRGKLTWTPNAKVLEALDKAFYLAFDNVEATGKRIMLALDVSGSMGAPVSGLDAVNCREASVAMALVTLAKEDNVLVTGFTSGNMYQSGINELPITRGQRLDDVVNMVARLPFGGTDCALPMLCAQGSKLDIDAFVVFTDNETWQGDIHAHQALQQYRRATGIDAKLVVVGMSSNGFSIADPDDAGMMDVVGFDTAAPNLIADFIRGA